MISRAPVPFLLMLVLCLGGCSTPAESEAEIAARVEAVEEALLEADRAFAADTASRGAEGWAAWFAPGGVMLPAGMPLVRGREDIRDLMAPLFADPSTSLVWEPTEAHVAASGDLGYTLGWSELSRQGPEGEALVRRGKYLTVWALQPDGSWRVAVDAGTPDDPPDAD